MLALRVVLALVVSGAVLAHAAATHASQEEGAGSVGGDCESGLHALRAQCLMSPTNPTCPHTTPTAACCAAIHNYTRTGGCEMNATSAGVEWDTAACPNAPPLLSDLALTLCGDCFAVNSTGATVGVSECDGSRVDTAPSLAGSVVCTHGGLKVCGCDANVTVSGLGNQGQWHLADNCTGFLLCGSAPLETAVCGDWVVLSTHTVLRRDVGKVLLDGGSYSFIPSQLGLLTDVYLIFTYSLNATSIPTQIGLLTGLQVLELQNNQISEIPTEMASLTKLSSLDISTNLLTDMPAVMWSWRSLRHLQLQANFIRTVPSEITALSALTWVSWRGNLVLSLPSEIGLLTRLTYFSVDDSVINILPSEIGMLPEMKFVSARNAFITVIPTEFCLLTKLVALAFQNNQIGKLPSQIGLMTDLHGLIFTSNNIPVLPSQVGRMTGLRAIQMEHNKLETIPSQIGLIPNLNRLTLPYNALQSVPSELGLLTTLTYIQFDQNKLQALPSQLGLLRLLRFFNVQSNALQALPSELAQLSALTAFAGGNNWIGQSVDTIAGLFQSNRTVVLTNNLLEGPVANVSGFTPSVHFVEQNCLVPASNVRNQFAIDVCMRTELLQTPPLYSNHFEATFVFQELCPSYRGSNNYETNTSHVMWGYKLSGVGMTDADDSGAIAYGRPASVMLSGLEDGSYELDLQLIINLRSMDRCKEAVEKLFGAVRNCVYDSNSCFLNKNLVEIDCTLDDIQGSHQTFKWTVDTIAPSVRISARDLSGAPVDSSESMVGVDALVFNVEVSEQHTDFNKEDVAVSGCGSALVFDTTDGVEVFCRGIDQTHTVGVEVPRGAFHDRAGNTNEGASLHLLLSQCPIGTFQTIKGCHGAGIEDRCKECSVCAFPRVLEQQCTGHSDVQCSSMWMGLAPIWGSLLLAAATATAVNSVVPLTFSRLAFVAVIVFGGAASLAAGCYFVMYDATGWHYWLSIVFWVLPMCVNVVGSLAVHKRCVRYNQRYVVVVNQKPKALAVVILMSFISPRLLESFHEAIGSKHDWAVRRRIEAVASIPIFLQDIPQLAIQSLSIAEHGASYTSVLALVVVGLSVTFKVILALLRLRVASAHTTPGAVSLLLSEALTERERMAAASSVSGDDSTELERVRAENAELRAQLIALQAKRD